MVLVGIDPRVSRLGGDIVGHYTTDARQSFVMIGPSSLNNGNTLVSINKHNIIQYDMV